VSRCPGSEARVGHLDSRCGSARPRARRAALTSPLPYCFRRALEDRVLDSLCPAARGDKHPDEERGSVLAGRKVGGEAPDRAARVRPRPARYRILTSQGALFRAARAFDVERASSKTDVTRGEANSSVRKSPPANVVSWVEVLTPRKGAARGEQKAVQRHGGSRTRRRMPVLPSPSREDVGTGISCSLLLAVVGTIRGGPPTVGMPLCRPG
jgi:hypothetical protein